MNEPRLLPTLRVPESSTGYDRNFFREQCNEYILILRHGFFMAKNSFWSFGERTRLCMGDTLNLKATNTTAA